MPATIEIQILAVIAAATALMWIPYILAVILTHGLWAALRTPGPEPVSLAPWAARAKRAHANSVENLVVFAPLVLGAAFLGTTSNVTILAAELYLVSRVVHYIALTAGIPVIRTLSFLGGVTATLIFAMEIIANTA